MIARPVESQSSRLPGKRAHDMHRRHNPFGDDSDEEASTSAPRVAARGDDDGDESGAVDPAIQAFLESQQAAKHGDAESERLREERMRAGGVRGTKSRYQREKEEAERKKLEQEQEAVKAYAEFAAAMEGNGRSSRGWGTSATSSKDKGKAMGFVSAGGASTYTPVRQVASPDSRPATAQKSSTFGGAFEDDTNDAVQPAPRPKREPPGKKKGAMGDFLGEIQREQAEREEKYRHRIAEGQSVSSILALEGQKIGSRDLGDPLTTNVCVLNLPANICEQALGDFFCQWGDVGTVKIMWPRGEDMLGGAGGGITALRNTRSAGLTGFVCYMRREDAEYAIKEGDGISWGGCNIKLGWGKAMPKTPRPLYYMPAGSSRRKTRDDDPSDDWRSAEVSSRGRKRSRSPRDRPHRRVRRSPSPRSQLSAKMQDSETGHVIRTVTDRIAQYGYAFERLVRDREKDNPRFSWLREDTSVESQYFRMLVDPSFEPTLPDPPFGDEGYASLYDSDSGEDSEAERLKKQRKTATLGKLSRKRFEAALRCITPRRERIARAMAFAMEHASAADAVADILVQSLLIPTTPIPRKLARLYVVSDVLHNSAAPLPNAWKYRSAFESRVGIVFRHLGDVARSFPGIMKQEGFRMPLRALLDAWDSWLVFAPDVLAELRRSIEPGGGGARDPPSQPKHVMVPIDTPHGDTMGAEQDEEDIEGEPLDLPLRKATTTSQDTPKETSTKIVSDAAGLASGHRSDLGTAHVTGNHANDGEEQDGGNDDGGADEDDIDGEAF